MKTLQEYLMESMDMEVNERLMDGWFNTFEFKSQEKFSAFGPKSFGKYLNMVSDMQYEKLEAIKPWVYLGQTMERLWWESGYGYLSNEKYQHIMAIGKDGKIYSNDPQFMEQLGLTPKKNSKFDKASFDDEINGETIGFRNAIPGYNK